MRHTAVQPLGQVIGSISLRWSFIRVAFIKVVVHCSGLTSGWYFIRVITVSVKGGILSGLPLRVVFRQGSLSGWNFIRVASQGGILSG